MKKLLPLLLMIAAPPCFGQAWSGVLASSRATNWSNAGIPGGIPSRTTQCGSTIAAYSGTAATINSAISSCASGDYVSLGAGTFTLTTGIDFGGKSNVTLRGQGANSTFITFASTGQTAGSCNGFATAVVVCGSNSYPEAEQNFATWTAGFSQGATSITLSNSTNIVAGTTLLVLDQKDVTTDTGQIWNCVDTGVCSLEGQGGFARTDNTCSGGICSQAQTVLVTACSPSCNSGSSTTVTISPGLYMPNWASANGTGAYWATTPITLSGVENLSIDVTNLSGASGLILSNCYECWVSGVRTIDAGRNHHWLYGCVHCEDVNNYLYQAQTHGSSSYGIEVSTGGDNLIQNNICQQITQGCPNYTGSSEGDVDAYNVQFDQAAGAAYYAQSTPFEHASGTAMLLHEGDFGAMNADDTHGTHSFGTQFRSVLNGWQPTCSGSACSNPLYPVWLNVGSRYYNFVGNIIGQPSVSSTYTCTAPATCTGTPEFDLAYSSGTYTGYCTNPPTCSTFGNYDPLTANSLMLWGNYDVVNAATRFQTSEDASSFADATGSPSSYAGLGSPSTTLANSWFLTASTKPACGTGLSWWKNPTLGTCEPFPPVGPDIASGNLGTCSSGTYAGAMCKVGSTQCGTGISCNQAYAGHANLIPAADCALSVMGMPPDGTGSALSFNAASCYANDPVSSSIPSSSPLWLAKK